MHYVLSVDNNHRFQWINESKSLEHRVQLKKPSTHLKSIGFYAGRWKIADNKLGRSLALCFCRTDTERVLRQVSDRITVDGVVGNCSHNRRNCPAGVAAALSWRCTGRPVCISRVATWLRLDYKQFRLGATQSRPLCLRGPGVSNRWSVNAGGRWRPGWRRRDNNIRSCVNWRSGGATCSTRGRRRRLEHLEHTASNFYDICITDLQHVALVN